MVEGDGRDFEGAGGACAVVKWHWTKVACLEVETGRVQICAVQEVNIYAKVSCEMQEVQRTSSKAAWGGLGSGYSGPNESASSTTNNLMISAH